MEALYRLFTVCFMLRSVSVEGLSKSHDYPKMQLTEMLMLEYWRKSGHAIWDMMDGNMSMFNEEFGEIFFSILSRCVLGDHVKSEFDHMNDIYTLLPIYRAVKKEIMKDHDNSKHSLNWHHTIPVDSEEVHATVFFFKQLIREVRANTYQSYEIQPSHKMPAVIYTRNTRNVPIVFNPEIGDNLDPVFIGIRQTLCGVFLHKHQDLWPEARAHYEVGNINGVEAKAELADDVKQAEVSVVWGSPWEECVVGHFAVTRDFSDAEGTSGICVYRIIEILPTTRENGNVMHTFKGREYICNLSNHKSECVRGGVFRNYPNISQTAVVNNWYVISYFKKFNAQHKLPRSAVDDINLDNERDAIFTEVIH